MTTNMLIASILALSMSADEAGVVPLDDSLADGESVGEVVAESAGLLSCSNALNCAAAWLSIARASGPSCEPYGIAL